MSLTFVNNTAEYAGSALYVYGGTVEHCYTYTLFNNHSHSSYHHSHIIFKAIISNMLILPYHLTHSEYVSALKARKSRTIYIQGVYNGFKAQKYAY